MNPPELPQMAHLRPVAMRNSRLLTVLSGPVAAGVPRTEFARSRIGRARPDFRRLIRSAVCSAENAGHAVACTAHSAPILTVPDHRACSAEIGHALYHCLRRYWGALKPAPPAAS